MSIASVFRICPTTGLRVDRNAENLIKANAVVAVVFLLIGGLFGLSIALTRWPAVHLLPAEWFYLALTAHGFDVLLASRWRCCISPPRYCSTAGWPRPAGPGRSSA